MAGGLNKLSSRGVANLSRRGRHSDGGGLYLQIDGKGAKQWTFRFQLDGRRSEMGLGGVNAISLADARKIAAQCRADLAAGRNPIELRRSVDRTKRAAAADIGSAEARSFQTVADSMLAGKEAGWRNAKHRGQWRSTLATYAAPLLAMDVAEIRTEHVLGCLQPIWNTKAETASRVRGRIEAVLNAARARGLMPDDRANPARWRGHLDHLLSKPNKLTRGHFAALPWREMPGFMTKLREREAVAARALEFAILTAARPGEVRGMTWDEIDIIAGIWIVRGERMKAGREHRVPLSSRALTVLAAMGEPKGGAHVFPNDKGRQLSDMAFKALLDRMSVSGVTAHGFRSSFRDWAGDATQFAREDIEAALAHRLKDKAEAAYRRSDALEKRRTIMEAWATHCEPRDGVVIPLVRPSV